MISAQANASVQNTTSEGLIVSVVVASSSVIAKASVLIVKCCRKENIKHQNSVTN